ncbi:MAG: DinB family protein [Bryobacteraceae bacterium]
MCQHELKLLNESRTDTLWLTGGVSQAQSEFAPAYGKWSIGEVLHHLLLADQLYRGVFTELIEMKKAGKRAVVSEGFDRVNTAIAYIPRPVMAMAELPFTVLNLFVPAIFRELMAEYRLLPTQAPSVAEPGKGKNVDELRDGLRESCKLTTALFNANPNLNHREMRYRHPLLGDNSTLDLLRIVAFHEKRHQAQIQDLLRSRMYPRAA